MTAHGPMLRLHGVAVPASDHAKVKTLAAVFFGLTDAGTPKAAAWRWAVLTAIRVLAEARRSAP